MKKIQVIFAGLAIAFASVGVFANSLVTTTFYAGNSGETGAHCRTVVSLPAGCTTGDQCSKVQTINEVTGRFYFSKIVDSGSCQVVPGPDIQ